MLLWIIYAVLAAAGCVYFYRLVRFRIGLDRLRPGRAETRPTVAVIVAARNEEGEIGDCLAGILTQDYPSDRLQVVVVDDNSTDSTAEIVSRLAADHPNLSLIEAGPPPPGVAPKKHAVSCGVEATDSEIIAVTDADCRVEPGWIKGLVSHFRPDVGIVLGFTTYRRDPGLGRLLYGVQTLEFLSHVFCAAGAVGSGRAFNSNANNLAYRRAAYREVGGFASVDRYISGDDDLLLQTLVKKTRWRVDFATEPETYIRTRPTVTVAGAIRQRMRWASKWDAYTPTVVIFMVSTFLFFLGLFLLVPLGLAGLIYPWPPLALFGLKVAGDFVVMFRGARLFGVRGLMRYFPLVELVHLPLILTAAIGGQFTTHEWRGRRLARKL